MEKKLGISKDAIIKIEIGGAFYVNLQQTLLSLAAQKSPEEFTATLHKLKTESPQNEYELQILTIVSLIIEIERCAKQQNQLVEVELPEPPPTEESPKV